MVHTQCVESFNNKIKTKIKAMKGFCEENRRIFIDEVIFIDLFKGFAYAEAVHYKIFTSRFFSLDFAWI